MPLTFSHPAAVIPFGRRGLILSALVVGSMAPDFPYFILAEGLYFFSHTIWGMIFWCLPMGFLVLWIFHKYLKFPMVSLLPLNHQKRLLLITEKFSFRPVRRSLQIALSIMIGALTHIVWDSFTHKHGWMVQFFPGLNFPIFTLPGTPFSFPLYRLLQHTSTLIGGVLLAYWYLKWYRSSSTVETENSWFPAPSTRIKILVGMASSALFFALWLAFLAVPSFHNIYYIRLFFFDVTVISSSIFFVELCLYSAYWNHIRQLTLKT